MTTNDAESKLDQYLLSNERCHFVGIGGVSMSPLAQILHNTGIEITGSDIIDSDATDTLRECGIKITIGHSAENVKGAGYVIRTAAAHEDNTEIKAARELSIPVFERAEVWGYIMRGYKNAICISGAHGKTTTTSMISHILLTAGADPTIMIGGTLPEIKSGHHVGRGDTIVLESCEYYNSFHNFAPTVAVVLNIDRDHLDFFEDLDAIKSSFRKFASLVPESGCVICNGDNQNTMDALSDLRRKTITFGFGEADVCATNVNITGRYPSMDVLFNSEKSCSIRLCIPGKHNLQNALAATAVCLHLGVPKDIIERGLLSYTGTGRRFEYKGTYNGAEVYDDYAHHPHELKELLDAVTAIGSYKRVVLAFQPHTYTRTKALFDDFAEQLRRPDVVFLAEIYSAREQNSIGISSGDLAKAIDGAQFISDFASLTKAIAAEAQRGDIVLTVGAGDIYKVGLELTSHSK